MAAATRLVKVDYAESRSKINPSAVVTYICRNTFKQNPDDGKIVIKMASLNDGLENTQSVKLS